MTKLLTLMALLVLSISSVNAGAPLPGNVQSDMPINSAKPKTHTFHLKKLLHHIAMVPLVITEACCLGAAACPYGYYGGSYAPAPTGFGYNSYSYNPTQGLTTTRIGDYYTGGYGYNSYSYNPAQGLTATRIGSY